MIKICKQHNCEKEYRQRVVSSKIRNEWICLICESERGKRYYEDNKNERIDYQNQYYIDNKKEIIEYKQDFYSDNQEDILKYKKNYYQNNKKIIRAIQNKYKKTRRTIDVIFRLRESCSRMISRAMNGNKNNLSILDYLSYSIQELKEHIENQFEPWMSWENQGTYKLDEWNDNDQLTWTWQLDHIVPQADLPYISMEDDNFKKCWALNNLRPLSSKQNLLDGIGRTRHQK